MCELLITVHSHGGTLRLRSHLPDSTILLTPGALIGDGDTVIIGSDDAGVATFVGTCRDARGGDH